MINGKGGEATVFDSMYCPCKNPKTMSTVWNQQVRYFQCERNIRKPYVHALLITNLYKAPCDMRDQGFRVVLSIDANDDVRDVYVFAALSCTGITEAIISNHREESIPATRAKNKQRKLTDNI